MLKKIATGVTLAFVTSIGYAAGLEPVKTTAQNALDTLEESSVVIVTIAIAVAAILIMFRAANWGVIAAILIGGMLIGYGDDIARWVTNSTAA